MTSTTVGSKLSGVGSLTPEMFPGLEDVCTVARVCPMTQKRQNKCSDKRDTLFIRVISKRERKMARMQRKAAKPKRDARERYAFYLRKKYSGRYFDFCYHFSRFLSGRGKATFYTEIATELRQQVVEQAKQQKKAAWKKGELSSRAQKIKVNFSQVNYVDELPEGKPYSFGDWISEKMQVVPERKVRVRQQDVANLLVGPRIEVPVREKPIELLLKIQLAIAVLKSKRTNRTLSCVQKMLSKLVVLSAIKDIKSQEQIRPEMEEMVDKSQASNVVLTNVAGVATQKPIETVISDFWSKASVSSGMDNYDQLTDRWTLLSQGTWTSNDAKGTALTYIKLPEDFVSKNNQSPAFAPFGQYAYWKGDIKIRVHLNTNMFNVGTLIGSWYYGCYADAYQGSLRQNLGSLVQLPHVFIDASQSNDIEMTIPFRSYKSSLSMYKRENDGYYANMGIFKLHVFNQLLLATGESKKEITYSIYVSFPNSKFYGMVPRDSTQMPSIRPEMFPLIKAKKIINVASDCLDMILPDPNRDNPPVEVRPLNVVPTPSCSFATGDMDVDVVNMARLVPTGQTPHPIGSSTQDDEMDILSVARRLGYLTTSTWSVDDVPGTIIKDFAASPLQSCYDSVVVKGNTISRNCNVYTPVHNIANMFGFWRGSLDLHLKIVSSPIQTGSLLIGYIPRRDFALTTLNSVGILKNCYSAVVDIETVKEFVFRIPYIADKPWWPKRKDLNFGAKLELIDPPGKVYVVVLNQLIVNKATVPSKIFINFFLSAGPDFEVCLPVAPSIGLSFNVDMDRANISDPIIKDGYLNDCGIGTWRYSGKAVVFRYGNGTDHITQVQNFVYGHIYKIATFDEKTTGAVKANDLVLDCKYHDGVFSAKNQLIWHAGTIQFTHFTRFIVNNDKDTYQYIVGFTCYAAARAFVNKCPPDFGNSNMDYAYQVIKDEYVKLAITWGKTVFTHVVESEIRPEMDEQILLDPGSSNLISTQFGRLTFGEAVKSLKTLGRRYQKYTTLSFPADAVSAPESLNCNAYLPISPRGLDLDLHNFTDNLIRDGTIPYIASAYRYFRGGLRFKFVFRNLDNGMVYLQHVYDSKVVGNQAIYTCGRNESKAIQSGYAIITHNCGINNTLSVEIPYYLPTNLGLLQVASPYLKQETICDSLGYFAISVHPKIKQNVIVDVFFSLADDMKFSCFIGFPPVFEVASLEKKEDVEHGFEIIRPEMPLFGSRPEFKTLKSQNFHTKLSEVCIPVYNEEKAIAVFEQCLLDFDWKPSQRLYLVSYVLNKFRDAPSKGQFFVEADFYKVLEKGLNKSFFGYSAPAFYQEKLKDNPTVNADLDWSKLSIKSKVDKYLDSKLDKVVETGSSTAAKEVLAVLDGKSNSLWDYVCSIAQAVGGEWKHLLISAFSQVAHVLHCPSLTTFCLAVVTILVQLGVVCTSVVSKLIEVFKNSYERIYKIISNFAGKKKETAPATPQETEAGDKASTSAKVRPEGPDKLELLPDEKATLFATIVSGITGAVATGTKINTSNIPDFSKGLFDGISNTARSANQVTIFFKNNVSMFNKILNWITCRVFPSKAIDISLMDEEDYLKAWIEDINELLHPDNVDNVRTNPVMNARVYQAAVIAEAYRLKFCRSDRPNPVILQFCAKILNLRDELANAKIAPPIRFEPWVLCIAGESNVGKSHMIDSIVTQMLKKINYKSYGEKIYTRTSGNPYWNQCRSQPVVLYDDFMQITSPEQTAQDMAELFCLKSKAVFNPPQAAIEDKSIRYNPLSVVLACNNPFPNVSVVSDQKAWMRRRDVMCYVRKKPQYVETHPRDLPEDISKVYGHVDICVYLDPSDPSKQDQFSHTNISYLDFVALVTEKFEKYYKHELDEYNKRLARVFEFMPEVEEPISQVIQRYERHLKQINEVFKTKDKELIFDPNLGTRLITPEYLHEKKTVRGEGPLKDCPHAPFNGKEWQWCEDYDGFAEANGFLPNDGSKEKGAFYNLLNYKQSCREEPCAEDTCAWKIPGKKDQDMTAWKARNSVSFDLRKELAEAGEVRQVVPKYFDLKNLAPSAFHMQHQEETEKLMKELHDMVCSSKKRLEAEAEKKGFKYKLMRAAKWVLQKIWRIISFVCFMTASYAAMNFIGGKLNIFPFDKATRSACVQYTDGSMPSKDFVKLDQKIASKQIEGNMAYDLKIPAAARSVVLPKVQGQMASDVENSMINLIKRNTFFLVQHTESGHTRSMRCFGLFGHSGLIVDHYYYASVVGDPDRSCRYTVICNNAEYVVNFSELRYTKFESSALVCVELPNHIPSFKDVRSKLIGSDQTQNLSSEAKLFEISVGTSNAFMVTVHPFRIGFRKSLNVPGQGYGATDVNNLYSYPLSKIGLCGSVLVSNANIPNPIIGIHIAGTTDSTVGFSEAIVRESFTEVRSEGPADRFEPRLGDVKSAFVSMPCNILNLGVVERKLAHNSPSTSKQVHTECYNQIFPSTYDIPVLTDKDPRIADNPFSPMQFGCSYHAMNPVPFEQSKLDRVIDFYSEKINAMATPRRPNVGVLSREQATVGIPDLPHYDPIEFDTSEGFPFVSERPKGHKNKKWLFDLELLESGYKLNSFNSKLLQVMDLKDDMRKRDIVPFTVFTDCLKDQKLPSEKCVKMGGTRIFSISPADFTIQCRQYFMDFAVAYQEARFDVDHAIGIDVKSNHWSELAHRLLTIGNNIVVADYSKFGPTLMSKCVIGAFKIMSNWYKFNGDVSKENEQIRKIMCFETCNSYHLMFNLVYLTACGSPSGHPLTTIINSIVNCLYISYTWISLGFSLNDYEINVKLITYGDDLIMSVSDEFISKFNCEVIQKVLNDYHIIITDASKTGQIVMKRSLLDPEVTFLKCKFVLHPFRHGCYLACMDQRSALEICNWTFKSNCLRERSLESCCAMLENCFGFGPTQYSEIRNKVLSYWARKKVFIIIPTWQEMDERCFGSSDCRLVKI